MLSLCYNEPAATIEGILLKASGLPTRASIMPGNCTRKLHICALCMGRSVLYPSMEGSGKEVGREGWGGEG